MSALRPIAFYLPQFHPTRENDAFWGKGFTEWTNVVRGRPLFPGHDQPHLPADLGFYDLRVPEVRAAQAELAREHGVHGFCYYHYWFEGKRLLGRPFDEVLESGAPELPFCLCWANESWTAGWAGRDGDLLVEQRYSPEDDREHLRWLARAFADPRYLRVDGKPLFLVYRASSLPDPRRTTEVWRGEALRLGIGELFLARVEAWVSDRDDPTALGFDAGVEFAPRWEELGRRLRGRTRFRRGLLRPAHGAFRDHMVHDYADVARVAMERELPGYRYFRCVTPSFDNTARRPQGAVVLHGAGPEPYERWLRRAARQTLERGESLLFVNAWNEWAEGNHLEPCQRFGRGYLEATRRVVEECAAGAPAANGRGRSA